jgi:hypothetical protein
MSLGLFTIPAFDCITGLCNRHLTLLGLGWLVGWLVNGFTTGSAHRLGPCAQMTEPVWIQIPESHPTKMLSPNGGVGVKNMQIKALSINY